MSKRALLLLALAPLAALAAGVTGARDRPSVPAEAPKGPDGKPGPKADDDKGREADERAIRETARAFGAAFAKNDAKALAALWTEQGEYHDDGGGVLRGRAALEKAYAEFFKKRPKSQVDVEVLSVRFPSRDTAIEEGVLRQKLAGPELPDSTRYSALHVREKGSWKIAFVREWGGSEDKLEDLTWLLGRWVAKSKKGEVHLHFEWNEAKSLIRNHFSVREGGRVTSSGTQVIRVDPKTGQLRSWAFDDEGGHGQALWFRDGNRWVQDSVGVLPDGTDTSAFNVLTRVDDDAFVWRSVDRTVGGEAVPDTEPVKVTRVKAKPGK